VEKEDKFQQTYRKYEKDLAWMPIEQFNELIDPTKTLVINIAKMDHDKRRIVAEVTELRGSCAAYYKKGDKLVFNVVGMFLLEESSVKVACSWLLGNLVPSFACNEALLGYDIEFKEPFYDLVECPDPGPPTGGGHIKVKLYME